MDTSLNYCFISDSEGEVQTEFYNENGNPQYKYFYPDAESIVKMMKKVSDEISTKPRPLADELWSLEMRVVNNFPDMYSFAKS